MARKNDPSLLVLMSLATSPKHGYALLADIERFAHIPLGPGTLYGAITRLEEEGLIEPLEAEGRRRPYRITQKGMTTHATVLDEMAAVVDLGRTRPGVGAIAGLEIQPG
jgi:DNA-binding PadR family transcriptional regulator